MVKRWAAASATTPDPDKFIAFLKENMARFKAGQ